jgi:predicted nucleotide-binding protein
VATDPLRQQLEKQLHPRYVRQLITEKASKHALSQHEALLAVARDRGIKNWTKHASPEELVTLRNLGSGQAVPAAAAPPAASAPARAVPRRAATNAATRPAKAKGPRDKVFVVHGRNKQIRSAMFTFLRDVDLNPVEWGEALKATGKASPYIGETLEAAIKDVAAVVVLITPDDIVRLKKQFLVKSDGADEQTPQGQARPNVLFESGMAFGRHAEKTVFVTFGQVKPFTDIGGMHVVRMTNSGKKRQELVDKLKTAGADAKTDGRGDWLDEARSDFTLKEEDDADNEAP